MNEFIISVCAQPVKLVLCRYNLNTKWCVFICIYNNSCKTLIFEWMMFLNSINTLLTWPYIDIGHGLLFGRSKMFCLTWILCAKSFDTCTDVFYEHSQCTRITWLYFDLDITILLVWNVQIHDQKCCLSLNISTCNSYLSVDTCKDEVFTWQFYL